MQLLAVAAVIGVLVSLVAWCFLEAVHWVQEEAYVHLPRELGYRRSPDVVAAAGAGLRRRRDRARDHRLPGAGGHTRRGAQRGRRARRAAG